jgi:hypothetical protein
VDDNEEIVPGNPGEIPEVPDNCCIEFFLCLRTSARERDDLDYNKPFAVLWGDFEIFCILFVQQLVPVIVWNSERFNEC